MGPGSFLSSRGADVAGSRASTSSSESVVGVEHAVEAREEGVKRHLCCRPHQHQAPCGNENRLNGISICRTSQHEFPCIIG